MSQTPEDDDDCIQSLGSACERVDSHVYRPDDLAIERWDSLLRTPHIMSETQDQIQRIIKIRAVTIQAAALMLRCCPCSSSLDRAIHSLHDAQLQAITAIQANE